MPLGREVDLDPSDIVLDGDPALPSPIREQSPTPIFGPCLLCRNSMMDQDATWYGSRPRPRQHCPRWGPSSPPSKRGHSPQFSAHVCCGQTAEWIEMPLGNKVGHGPGRIVLHVDPAPRSQKGHSSPIFGRCLLWANGCPSQLLVSTCTD